MSRRTAVLVGAVGFLLGALLAVRLVAGNGWDPTVLTAFGEEAIPTTEYAEARIGEVSTRVAQGHDGKFFFVQAHDPFLFDPDENASVLDRPVYRSQRMLYPAVAGIGGLLTSQAIVWSLIVVNLAALGIGSWATARIAQRLGGSAWWGLAFGLNLGLISELMISGAGSLAMAMLVLGVLALMDDRVGWSILAFAGAALSREAMLVAAAGAAFHLWHTGDRRRAVGLAAIPTAATGLWALYVRSRLDWPSSAEVQEIGLPFQGFIEAMTDQRAQPINQLVGVLLLFILVRFAWGVARRPSLLGLATVGFVPLAMMFTFQVWFAYFDITRAVAPALTGYVLVVFVEARSAPTRESATV